MIKNFFQASAGIIVDGLYTSLVPFKNQTMWEDYSQIY